MVHSAAYPSVMSLERAWLYQAWRRGEIELVTSTAQIAELADVLARPRLQRFLDADEARGCHRYDVHDGQC